MNPNAALTEEVRQRVENLDKETCLEWGGNWNDETATVRELPIQTNHTSRTVVRNNADAITAFEKYTEYFEYVLEEYTPTSNATVLVPCGAQKPIGASAIHSKKLTALDRAGYDTYDLNIMSEPCTIIPHEHRLTMPAVNYDFPPEYTEQGTHEKVFELFSDRIATWIDEVDYDVIFSYLVQRHQNKLDAAVEKAETNPEVVEIPGASYNPESESYSGDTFKTTEQIEHKLRAARALLHNAGNEVIEPLPEESQKFYEERLTA